MKQAIGPGGTEGVQAAYKAALQRQKINHFNYLPCLKEMEQIPLRTLDMTHPT